MLNIGNPVAIRYAVKLIKQNSTFQELQYEIESVFDIHLCLQPPLSNPPHFSLSEPCLLGLSLNCLNFQRLGDRLVAGMIGTDPVVADFSNCLEKFNELTHLSDNLVWYFAFSEPAAGTVATLLAGRLRKLDSISGGGKRFVSLPKRHHWFRSPAAVYWRRLSGEQSGGSVKLITHPYLGPRLRKSGVISPISHMTLWLPRVLYLHLSSMATQFLHELTCLMKEFLVLMGYFYQT